MEYNKKQEAKIKTAETKFSKKGRIRDSKIRGGLNIFNLNAKIQITM
jgi:hypothetical protein